MNCLKSEISPCPGWYCGRICFENATLSSCGPCPRGFRRNATNFICEQCTGQPLLYDWLYLGFMALLVLVMHWFFIDMISMRRSFSKQVLILHATAFFEVLLAGIITLLVTAPVGSFNIISCNVDSLSDWYTLFHNPTPNFDKKTYCTQEAVYPLYTMVIIFYGLTLLIMLLVRPWIGRRLVSQRQSKASIYTAMYFIPLLILIHTMIGGLLYYSFPYLTIVMSVISVAAHFAIRLEQQWFSLIVTTIIEPRNVVILLGHWCLHAYGILSIICNQLINNNSGSNNTLLASSLLLVPVPTLFYIFTVRFTNPNCFF